MESFNEFLNSEQIIYHKNNISDFNILFSNSELEVIYNNIDKTDYSVMARPRWLDLNDILDKIINVKRKHQYMTLNKISIKTIHETFPPINDYVFYYKIKN
jgi:hypothetical protein